MTARRAALLAWLLVALTLALAGVQTWQFLGWSVVRESPSGWPVLAVGMPLWAALGAVIVSRHPRHRIGWLFLGAATLAALNDVLLAYDAIATSGADPHPAPFWPWALWLALFLDAPQPLFFLVLAFLLFPTGHLPSRRWRPLLWAAWLSFGGFVLLLAVAIPPWTIGLDNREDLFEGPVTVVGIALLVSLLVELLLAAASVVVRMRRARGVEREQLRWLAVTSSLVAVGFVFAAFAPWQTGAGGWVRVLPLQVSVLAVFVGASLAILRHRLFDLDLVMSRAILLTVSTGAVAVGYVLVVVLVSALVPPRVSSGFWPSLLATAAVALAFQPLRRRVVRLADRVAYGRRSVPYEALADFGRNLARAPGVTDLMRNVAQAVVEATGARRAVAVLELPDGTGVAESWPTGAHPSAAGPRQGTEPEPGGVTFPVLDGGDRLARVELELAPGRRLTEPERDLVQRLLAQSALAVRNLRLETDLEAGVAELARRTGALVESRRRLVLARDEEKARFAGALRQTVLPHLLPMPDRLRTAAGAEAGGGTAPDRTAALAAAERAAAVAALDELRLLVRSSPQRAAADQAASSRSGPNADLVT